MTRITKTFLDKVKRNTQANAHGQNLEFIARHIKSPLAMKFKKINTAHNKAGYLTERLNKSRRILSMKLKKELIKKFPKEYTSIMRRL